MGQRARLGVVRHRRCKFDGQDIAAKRSSGAHCWQNATSWLPHHERVAIERIHDVASRVKERLN
jgi:hypothetical protein